MPPDRVAAGIAPRRRYVGNDCGDINGGGNNDANSIDWTTGRIIGARRGGGRLPSTVTTTASYRKHPMTPFFPSSRRGSTLVPTTTAKPSAADIDSACPDSLPATPKPVMRRIPSAVSIGGSIIDCEPSTSAHPRKRQKQNHQKVAHFIDTLFRSTTDFAQTVLPRLYGHKNFQSFVRQLNKYDFHKVRVTDSDSTSESEKEREMSTGFYHDLFLRDRDDLLCHISRKKTGLRTELLQESCADDVSFSSAEPSRPSDDPLVASRMDTVSSEAAQRIISQLEQKVKHLTAMQESAMNCVAQVYERFNLLRLEMMQWKESVVQENVVDRLMQMESAGCDPQKNIQLLQMMRFPPAFPQWESDFRPQSRSCLPQQSLPIGQPSNNGFVSNLFSSSPMGDLHTSFNSMSSSAANIYQPNVYPVNHQFSSDNSRFLNSLPSSAWRGTNFLLSEMYGLGSCSVPVDPNLQNMFCGSEVLNTGVAVPFEASLAVQQSSAAKQSRALVIADSAVQTVCIHTLKSLGMVVDHVASAASFKLRYAINQSNSVAEYDTKHYEIVLLDLDVKWIDAASNKTNTAQMIRTVKCRESSRTKVIAISSVEGLMEDAQQDLQGWLKGLGVAEVLKKPFASENVRMVVGALLGQ